MNHLGDANKMVGDTPRTDDQECDMFVGVSTFTPEDVQQAFNFARTLERELNAAHDRIQSLIEERDRANRLAEWKWNLRDEFQLLLGTDKIEEGIEVVKELKRHIKRLEEESESRWMLAQSATGSCAEMSSRIKRLEEAGDAIAKIIGPPGSAHWADENQVDAAWNNWRKAKEAKP